MAKKKRKIIYLSRMLGSEDRRRGWWGGGDVPARRSSHDLVFTSSPPAAGSSSSCKYKIEFNRKHKKENHQDTQTTQLPNKYTRFMLYGRILTRSIANFSLIPLKPNSHPKILSCRQTRPHFPLLTSSSPTLG